MAHVRSALVALASSMLLIQVTPPPIEDRRDASFAGKRDVDADQVETLRRASCAPAARAVLSAVGIEGS